MIAPPVPGFISHGAPPGTGSDRQPCCFARRKRHVNHPARVHLGDLIGRGIVRFAGRHVEEPRLLRHLQRPRRYFLEPRRVADVVVGDALRGQRPPASHERIEILVIAGDTETLDLRVVGKANEIVRARAQLHEPAFGVVAHDNRTRAAIVGGRLQGCSNLLVGRLGKRRAGNEEQADEYHALHNLVHEGSWKYLAIISALRTRGCALFADIFRMAYPAHAPSGRGRSGTASAGRRPSAEPMSNSMPSEVWPAICRGSRLTTNNA